MQQLRAHFWRPKRGALERFLVLSCSLLRAVRPTSGRGLTFHPLPRLDESAEYGANARLVAPAARLEPVEDIAIKTDVNNLLGGRRSNYDALPVCFALATKNFRLILSAEKSCDIFECK
jgi:hypothetical protein